MVKRFTELLLGYQLHQEVSKNHHFRDLPCPRCQGHSDWKEFLKCNQRDATYKNFIIITAVHVSGTSRPSSGAYGNCKCSL